MPLVEVTIIEGRGQDAKAKLAAKITDAVIESVGAPREAIRVIIREVPAEHWFVGGVAKPPVAPGT